MTDMYVSNIERFAIKDGPGIRTVVFLQGCPLRCPWCANPETRYAGHDKVKKMSVEDVMAVVLRDMDYYRNSGGGLTVSGGEALLRYEALLELLKMAKEYGIHTAVETSGQASREAVMACLPYVDLWLYDVKHTDLEKLESVTGADYGTVFGNLRMVAETDPAKVVFRLPCIPGFNLNEGYFDSVFELARLLGVERIDLLPYHTLGVAKYERMGIEYRYAGYEAVDRSELEQYRQRGLERGFDIRL